MKKQAAIYMTGLTGAFALASLFCLPGLAQSLKSDPSLFHEKAENAYVVVPFVATDDTPSTRSFVEKATARTSLGEIEPETFSDLSYTSSTPPLEVTFKITGGHYNGAVIGGNLFLQTDIPEAPLVRFSRAEQGKLYTLMMIDFDGDASGSWPDKVPPGRNSPVRHWIVGNIPGESLRGSGYSEDRQAAPAASQADQSSAASGAGSGLVSSTGVTVLQAYRHPHIPVVSDRYGIYLFEQEKRIEFDQAPDPITNFDYRGFLSRYRLLGPVASNWFVAIYTSEQPFSGKPFHGNDVSATWHQDLGSGDLGRER